MRRHHFSSTYATAAFLTCALTQRTGNHSYPEKIVYRYNLLLQTFYFDKVQNTECISFL